MQTTQNMYLNPMAPSSRRAAMYLLLILALFIAVGFAGYYYGFLGFIYQVMIPQVFNNYSLVTLAVIFGIAAFFSPCTFTVLPAYVAYHFRHGPEQSSKRSIIPALSFGLVAALGVITVDIVVGLIIAALGSTAPFANDPRQDTALILGIRVAAGLLIAFMGILTVVEKSFGVPFFQKISSRMSLKRGMFLYGVLYNGAALGCTGPILLGLILYALTTGSFTSALSAFVVFALTMGVLMVMLTTSITMFKGKVVPRLIPLAPTIKKFAGVVMIIVGFAVALLTLEGNKIFVKIFFPFLNLKS